MPGFGFFAPVAVLVAAYVLIVIERINRAVIALLGACLVIALGLVNQRDALNAIDFDTMGLLAGMMIIVSIARRSGVFAYLAMRTAQLVGGSPAAILATLAVVTAVLSAFVNNVTVVLLVVPVTFVVCETLRVAVYPFLLAEIFAGNIGGTATLIGDPPNILIGSAAGLGFNDFAVNLAPISIAVLALQILAVHVFWGKSLLAASEDRTRIMALKAKETITDTYLLICSLVVIAAVVVALAAADGRHLQPATIALSGAGVLLLLESLPHGRERGEQNISLALGEVDWITLIFLTGLFVMIGAVAQAGVLRFLGAEFLHLVGHDPKIAASAILWLSAALSAIVDNVPYVAAMIPLVKSMAPALGGKAAIIPLWWSLALGAGFGGNGTLIGASANLAVAALAEKNGVEFRFTTFAATALPLVLASMVMTEIYLIWRYF